MREEDREFPLLFTSWSSACWDMIHLCEELDCCRVFQEDDNLGPFRDIYHLHFQGRSANYMHRKRLCRQSEYQSKLDKREHIRCILKEYDSQKRTLLGVKSRITAQGLRYRFTKYS